MRSLFPTLLFILLLTLFNACRDDDSDLQLNNELVLLQNIEKLNDENSLVVQVMASGVFDFQIEREFALSGGEIVCKGTNGVRFAKYVDVYLGEGHQVVVYKEDGVYYGEIE